MNIYADIIIIFFKTVSQCPRKTHFALRRRPFPAILKKEKTSNSSDRSLIRLHFSQSYIDKAIKYCQKRYATSYNRPAIDREFILNSPDSLRPSTSCRRFTPDHEGRPCPPGVHRPSPTIYRGYAPLQTFPKTLKLSPITSFNSTYLGNLVMASPERS